MHSLHPGSYKSPAQVQGEEDRLQMVSGKVLEEDIGPELLPQLFSKCNLPHRDSCLYFINEKLKHRKVMVVDLQCILWKYQNC